MSVVIKALVIEQTDDQVIDDRHCPAHGLFGHAGLVFLKSNIAPGVQTILDAPFTAYNFQKTFRICVRRRQARDFRDI